jgi:hypothetical protein
VDDIAPALRHEGIDRAVDAPHCIIPEGRQVCFNIDGGAGRPEMEGPGRDPGITEQDSRKEVLGRMLLTMVATAAAVELEFHFVARQRGQGPGEPMHDPALFLRHGFEGYSAEAPSVTGLASTFRIEQGCIEMDQLPVG